jgi:hypothetical protein
MTNKEMLIWCNTPKNSAEFFSLGNGYKNATTPGLPLGRKIGLPALVFQTKVSIFKAVEPAPTCDFRS